MEIDDLRTFVEVADAGGVNSAARRLGLAKSIVSRRVLRLEEELGVQLLTRSTRGAGLTEAGTLFRERAADICASIDAAREEMSPEGELRGLLRVAAPASFAAQLAKSLAEFGRQHPSLHVHVRFNDRYVDLVAEGFDCGIRVGYLPDSNLVARKIGTLGVKLYASPSYVAQHGTPQSPSDIIKHSAITPATDAWTFTKDNQSVTVHPQGRFKADSAHVLVEAAVAGIGIVAMGEIMADPYVAAGALVPIMTEYQLPPVGIFIVRPPGQKPTRKVRLLIDLLAEEFAATKQR
ncbi:LysR family transcriptional regulator [Agrobacterium sp. AGB01]|uniref:LysR family transcriptional regulator n=1 Tax=Agrobacterium sp. AGB01 TaxID=2769302 RepID=UPI00178730FF|nr:LysR family transcriptional regulator [Agrobacterium sp. AGB01]MBD9388601.1 LysR family transcriptional regulator [Agrobacterium sp. AGB01]